MINVENIKVYNMDRAILACRNPYDSWSRSDSRFETDEDGKEKYIIGEADMQLLQRLFKAGTEHRKYMRQILVSMDITAPFYWWKQADCYSVGVTKNSCSTMHTIAKKEFTLHDFSFDNIDDESRKKDKGIALAIISYLNLVRDDYNSTKDKDIWRFLVQILPESYNQKRTVTMNYEVVANIIRQRRHHKLKEWDEFIAILLKELPYLKEIMGETDGE